MMSLRSTALAVRRWFSPSGRDHGWMPLAYLGYLVFLFAPLLMRLLPSGISQPIPFRLDATLASIALFLPMYAVVWRGAVRTQVAAVIGIFVLGLTLFPFNPYSNTYVIYAASLSAILALPLAMRVLMLGVMLALFVVSMWLLGVPPTLVVFVAIITVVIGVAAFTANHFQVARERKRAELKLSQDEVRRIAAFAERERIGRDLHDLLGHTLSMVALKAELAGKLALRDGEAAKREIDEVASIARDALAQVRSAVSGIRNAELAAELASARVLLEAEGVALSSQVDAVAMSPAVESTLALVLREAATNIQRHAGARHARVALRDESGGLRLEIEDDGRGGELRAGNGLSGMRERVAALGGSLEFGAVLPSGTRLSVRLPNPEGA